MPACGFRSHLGSASQPRRGALQSSVITIRRLLLRPAVAGPGRGKENCRSLRVILTSASAL
jgi:hypothetical protein